MIRLLPALLMGASLAAPAFAADPGTASSGADPVYSVKISLSADDPDVHRGTTQADLVEFYVFVDGAPVRGAEFGIDIEGGSLVAYVIDTDKAWVSLPMENPYPGTIAQVKAGPDCFDAPTYFGRLMVRPDRPGGPVQLRVIPSVRAKQAVVLHCDNSGERELLGVNAAVNAEPAAPERIVSVKQQPAPGHEQAQDPGLGM